MTALRRWWFWWRLPRFKTDEQLVRLIAQAAARLAILKGVRA